LRETEEIEGELEGFREELGELWEENIEREFFKLVKRYRVRPRDALAFLRRKYLVKKTKIAELPIGKFRNSVRVRVVEMMKWDFDGIFGDETGMIPFIYREKFSISQGDSLEISNFHVRVLRGIPVISLDDRSKIKKCSEVQFRNPELRISDVFRRRVNFRIRLSGCITSLVSLSPEDSELSFILDDGSASIIAVAGREIAEKILGASLKNFEESELRKRLPGRFISVEGTLIRSSKEFLRIERAERVSSIPLRVLEEFFEVISDERTSNENILQRVEEL